MTLFVIMTVIFDVLFVLVSWKSVRDGDVGCYKRIVLSVLSAVFVALCASYVFESWCFAIAVFFLTPLPAYIFFVFIWPSEGGGGSADQPQKRDEDFIYGSH